MSNGQNDPTNGQARRNQAIDMYLAAKNPNPSRKEANSASKQ